MIQGLLPLVRGRLRNPRAEWPAGSPLRADRTLPGALPTSDHGSGIAIH